MFHSVKKLYGFQIRATDGDIGQARDLFFDDQTWTVRYLVVDTGHWLPGRKVLLTPGAIRNIDEAQRSISVGLTREKIQDSPPVSNDQPVSAQRQMELHEYFAWEVYWGGGLSGLQAPAPYVPHVEEQAADAAGESRPGNAKDPHLRSVRAVTGYHIQARDGQIGHVEDFLIEDESWSVRYLVINTRNWLPGRKVMVFAPTWIQRIDWPSSSVFVDLPREKIREGPEHNPERPLTREDEAAVHEYYGKAKYW